MAVITVFTTIILTTILAISIYDFYSLFFKEENVISKRMLILGITAYFCISVCMNLFEKPSEFNMIITYISLFIISLVYKGNLISKIFVAFFTTLAIVGFEMIPVYIASGLFEKTIDILLSDEITVLMLFAFSRLIPYIFLQVIKIVVAKRKNKTNTTHNLKLEEWGIIITLPLFSVSLIFLIYKVSESLKGVESLYISVSILLILLLNIIFYSIYMKTLKLTQIEANLVLQEQQNHYYINQYDELKLNLDEVHKFKHDAKHIFLNAIMEFSEESNIPVSDVLFHRVNTMIEDLYLENYKCYTGVSSIDMILNYQSNKAEKYKINFITNISQNLEINIDSKTLAIIIGNALDNAIEACIKHSKGEVEIVLLNNNDNLYISVSNEYEGEIIFQDELPLTNKDNPRVHGIGLNNIRQLVKSNNGFMSITTESNVFSLQITFVNMRKM
ncbi:MAG: GHKL domain-containing protein [Eubacteriales bacterium]